jgi:hypothetical protein
MKIETAIKQIQKEADFHGHGPVGNTARHSKARQACFIVKTQWKRLLFLCRRAQEMFAPVDQ